MTLIYFLLILGVIIFIHELGHFIFAKLFGVHVYEFSLGMGPQLFKWNRKNDPTDYSLRLFPIGGYVAIAGEDNLEEDKKIPDDKKLPNKTWFQRLIIMVAGALFNVLFAATLILGLALIFGHPKIEPYLGDMIEDYPAYEAGLEKGDLVLSVNGAKTASYDELLLRLTEAGGEGAIFEVQKQDGKIEFYNITPKEEGDSYIYGFRQSATRERGIIDSFIYTGKKTLALINTMALTITGLFKGLISPSQFSGPVGIYSIIGEQASVDFTNLIYLTAYLSLNIGFINLLPLPALDGGKIFFLILEKILRKPVSPKIEGAIHYIGFMLLMLFMLIITFNDIFKLGG